MSALLMVTGKIGPAFTAQVQANTYVFEHVDGTLEGPVMTETMRDGTFTELSNLIEDRAARRTGSIADVKFVHEGPTQGFRY